MLVGKSSMNHYNRNTMYDDSSMIVRVVVNKRMSSNWFVFDNDGKRMAVVPS